MVKKRHHYIPECYSKGFLIDNNNTLYEYEKGNTKSPQIRTPKNLGVEKYYYAFDHIEGYKDTNTIEDMFSIVEDQWPRLIDIFQCRNKPHANDVNNLCTFLAIMRVRVPNFRLCLESMRAEAARTTGMLMAKNDKKFIEDHNKKLLAATKKGNKKEVEALIEAKRMLEEGNLNISIDPQTSLMGIKYFENFHKYFMDLNWSVFQTEYDQDFITSDNPVVWYDLALSISNKIFIPYRADLTSEATEVIMPLTKKLILVGNRVFKNKFMYGTITHKRKIKELNRKIAISAEKYIYSSQGHLNKFVKKYSNVAPRVEFHRIPKSNNDDKKGFYLINQAGLGEPEPLPEWKDDK